MESLMMFLIYHPYLTALAIFVILLGHIGLCYLIGGRLEKAGKAHILEETRVFLAFSVGSALLCSTIFAGVGMFSTFAQFTDYPKVREYNAQRYLENMPIKDKRLDSAMHSLSDDFVNGKDSLLQFELQSTKFYDYSNHPTMRFEKPYRVAFVSLDAETSKVKHVTDLGKVTEVNLKDHECDIMVIVGVPEWEVK